jgi:hypothetical protein
MVLRLLESHRANQDRVSGLIAMNKTSVFLLRHPPTQTVRQLVDLVYTVHPYSHLLQ